MGNKQKSMEMAKRGPKTVPTGLKLVTDTLRPHRVNPDEPQPELALPDAPDHLSPQAHTEWDRVAAELAALGMQADLGTWMLLEGHPRHQQSPGKLKKRTGRAV